MSFRKQAADRRHPLAGSRKVAGQHYLLAGSRKADHFRSCVIGRALRMRMGYCHQVGGCCQIRACLGIEGNYSRFHSTWNAVCVNSVCKYCDYEH